MLPRRCCRAALHDQQPLIACGGAVHAAAGHIKAAASLGAVLGAIEVHHALASGDIPMLKPVLMALQ